MSQSNFGPDNPTPLILSPRLNGVDLISWAGSHGHEIEKALDHHCALLFRGFGVTSAEDLEAVVTAISGDTLAYREQSSPRITVAGNVYTSTEHPPDQHIFLHNENSYQSIWPMKLFFLCQQAPKTRGETPIADCRKILGAIDPAIVAEFEERSFRIVRTYNPGMGLSWKQVFGTEDPSLVDSYCASKNIETQWLDDGRLRTIAIRSATARHPRTGDKVWFNHGTFFHVSTLDPSLVESLRSQLSEENLPTNTYYGDGAPIEPSVLDHLRKAYLENTILFSWQEGDLLLVDNMLCAHGRSPFEGDRRILVAMSEPMDRQKLAEYGA